MDICIQTYSKRDLLYTLTRRDGKDEPVPPDVQGPSPSANFGSEARCPAVEMQVADAEESLTDLQTGRQAAAQAVPNRAVRPELNMDQKAQQHTLQESKSAFVLLRGDTLPAENHERECCVRTGCTRHSLATSRTARPFDNGSEGAERSYASKWVHQLNPFNPSQAPFDIQRPSVAL